ncbi:MAG: 4Fe-4S dicluster domain-containing protein [Gemmatimonadota bacterium]|nr:MAG: 4Fe-4S dicluster domain-containing protein [Gemmatimonadota bacterium]
MVIDLRRCVGCGACMIACKNENNVQENVAWASRISRTVGRFPYPKYEYMPTLCNHCEKAPCVKGCPTGAMHKADGDITMHSPGKCIGCRYCITNCPYGVIHFNEEGKHRFWSNDKPLIENGTASAREVTQKARGRVLPYYNPARELSNPGTGIRRKGIVEKCTFCDHRLIKGELPYCVEACPTDARIFGDLNDPNSEVNQILSKFNSRRLKEDLGTEPKVFYVREFNQGSYEKTKGMV